MSASNRDLHLTNLRTNLCSNRDVLNFPIVNFPFITSNLPAELAYGVYIFQYGCFELFPFRQNFVIFVRQIT